MKILSSVALRICVGIALFLLVFYGIEGHTCRTLRFDRPIKGQRLLNHVIDRKEANTEQWCRSFCLWNDNCASINFNDTEDSGKKLPCELNDSDAKQHPDDLKAEKEFTYYGTENPCIYGPCSNELCQTGFGSVGYRCICRPGYSGEACEVVNPASFDLYFAQNITKDFVAHDGLSVSNAFTVCYRVRTTETSVDRAVFSYATISSDNAILLITQRNKMRFWLDGQQSDFSFPATEDGSWHHICATWENVNGEFKLYRDGVLQATTLGLKKGHVISPAGILVIGQEQDSFGGGFDVSQSYIGELTDLNVWDRVLSPDQISNIWRSCHSFVGNVKKWADFRAGIRGSVRVLSPSACGP